MKKSDLLTYVFDNAMIVAQEVGKLNVTSNHFMIALFEALAADASGNAIPEISTSDAKNEIEGVREVLRSYAIPYGEIVDLISADIKSDEYNSSMDEFVFRKIKYTADSEARIKKVENIDTVAFLKLILKDPTDSIKKRIISPSTDASAEPALEPPVQDPNNPLLDFEKLLDSLNEMSDTEASGKQEPAPEAEPACATDKLCETVSSTKKIQTYLLERIFGQDDAINTFVSGYFQSQVNRAMNKQNKRPAAIFLFAGPPGVGKTFLAETVADALELPFRRFDMSEYSENESNLEFAGSDSVYKGGKRGNVTGFVDDNPHCVVLFDEIEKAHLNVIHLFLQILDAGRLRDNHSDKEVSFANAIIIFTTNVGRSLYEDSSISNLLPYRERK